jgi:hypothetical protein
MNEYEIRQRGKGGGTATPNPEDDLPLSCGLRCCPKQQTRGSERATCINTLLLWLKDMVLKMCISCLESVCHNIIKESMKCGYRLRCLIFLDRKVIGLQGYR